MDKTCAVAIWVCGEELEWCGKPATQAAYDSTGNLRYYCAEHFDHLVRVLRLWNDRNLYPDEVRKVRELNPGLL